MTKRSFSRSNRIVEQIRRELSAIIQIELKDPRVGMISLTAVEITPDYAHAKVYYSTLEPVEKRPEIEHGLRQAAGFLRHELSHRIRLHTLPDLTFIYDSSLETGAKMSKLIDDAIATASKNEMDD